jgi:hypothetical protein
MIRAKRELSMKKLKHSTVKLFPKFLFLIFPEQSSNTRTWFKFFISTEDGKIKLMFSNKDYLNKMCMWNLKGCDAGYNTQNY